MGNLSYKDRHKALGLCCDCSRPVFNGTRRCVIHTHSHRHVEAKYERRHREYRKIVTKAQRAEYIKKGRCSKCGGPRDDLTKRQCVNCRINVKTPSSRGGYGAYIQNGSS